MEKNILVIEDQFESMKASFELANSRKYNNELKVRPVPRSQDVDYANLSDYDLIFVDITLAKHSEMNGFGIIKKILDENLYPKDKIIILSAKDHILDGLKQNNLPPDINVMTKPFNFLKLESRLREFIPFSSES